MTRNKRQDWFFRWRKMPRRCGEGEQGRRVLEAGSSSCVRLQNVDDLLSVCPWYESPQRIISSTFLHLLPFSPSLQRPQCPLLRLVPVSPLWPFLSSSWQLRPHSPLPSSNMFCVFLSLSVQASNRLRLASLSLSPNRRGRCRESCKSFKCFVSPCELSSF